MGKDLIWLIDFKQYLLASGKKASSIKAPVINFVRHNKLFLFQLSTSLNLKARKLPKAINAPQS